MNQRDEAAFALVIVTLAFSVLLLCCNKPPPQLPRTSCINIEKAVQQEIECYDVAIGRAKKELFLA